MYKKLKLENTLVCLVVGGGGVIAVVEIRSNLPISLKKGVLYHTLVIAECNKVKLVVKFGQTRNLVHPYNMAGRVLHFLALSLP